MVDYPRQLLFVFSFFVRIIHGFHFWSRMVTSPKQKGVLTMVRLKTLELPLESL